jgi:hypothetical protein
VELCDRRIAALKVHDVPPLNRRSRTSEPWAYIVVKAVEILS